MIELRRRRHERGLTIPNAISFTDSYINEGLATCTNFSPANFLLFNAICQFIIPGKRICYLVQFVLMKTHKCALQLYRRHRWFRLTKKLSMVYQSRTVQHHRCLEWYWYVALSCIEFDGWFQGGLLEAPLYPLKPGVSRGPLGLSGGPGPLGPPRNSTTGL